MQTQLVSLAAALALGTAVGGCSGGATARSLSNGSTDAGATCTADTACGGSLVGAWKVTSSCLDVSGDLNLALVGAGCPTAKVTGSLRVTGTWTARADGTYTDETVTTGDEELTLAPSCLFISAAPVTCDGAANAIKALGFATLACTATSGGGCACTGTVHQTGGLGLVSVAPATAGTYTTAGTTATVSGHAGDQKYGYCVAGETLKLTPQGARPVVTGAISFQN
jgi:hypothetical protein